MLHNNFKPPLRIVLNNECNGKCDFCHQEGNSSQINMSLETLNQCIDAINELGITNVSLTGGEPTLHEKLAQIINNISDQCKNTRLSLTTNGLRLASVAPQIKHTIHGVNLSIISLSPSIAEKYQNVHPEDAFKGLDLFPANYKNLNVMILEDNYREIDEMINFCILKEYNLDLMFLSRSDSEYRMIQKHILNKIMMRGDAQILLQSTPVIQIRISEKNCIRVKHPSLSELVHREICKDCQDKKDCFERVCAVRVYGNEIVSPCLSNHIQEEKEGSILKKIEAVYNRLETICGIYKFDF